MKNSILFGFAIVVLIFLSGCNKGQVGVSGRVTYSDTGEPLEAGTVIFTTPDFYTRGEIKEDGRYTIGTYSEKDGLPPGSYQIYVSGAMRYDETTKPDGTAVEIPLITPKFCDPAESGLTCEVTGSTKTFDFQVDRAN